MIYSAEYTISIYLYALSCLLAHFALPHSMYNSHRIAWLRTWAWCSGGYTAARAHAFKVVVANIARIFYHNLIVAACFRAASTVL